MQISISNKKELNFCHCLVCSEKYILWQQFSTCQSGPLWVHRGHLGLPESKDIYIKIPNSTKISYEVTIKNDVTVRVATTWRAVLKGLGNRKSREPLPSGAAQHLPNSYAFQSLLPLTWIYLHDGGMKLASQCTHSYWGSDEHRQFDSERGEPETGLSTSP